MSYITDPYVELPLTIKTVSEFKRTRASDVDADGEKNDVGCSGQDSISEMRVPKTGTGNKQQCAASSGWSQNGHYFDAECNVAVPSTFVNNGQAVDTGAETPISQFMSRALDFESAFQFANAANKIASNVVEVNVVDTVSGRCVTVEPLSPQAAAKLSAEQVSESSAVQVAQTSAVQVAQTGAVQVAQTGAVQVAQTGAVQVAQTGAVQVAQSGAVQVAQSSAAQVNVAQHSAMRGGSTQICASQENQPGSSQSRSTRTEAVQESAEGLTVSQVSAKQVSAKQVSAKQVRATKVGAAQVGAAQVCADPVHSEDAFSLPPESIPSMPIEAIVEAAGQRVVQSKQSNVVSSAADTAVVQRRYLDQASVLRDPQESSSTTTTVEMDSFGRVSKSFFCGGETVNFSYDENGLLCEFNYAGMQWVRFEGGWSARDRQTEYRVEGNISVLSNGCLRIEREDVVRTLKMSGTRIDEHRSGSRTESRKLKNKPSPYDLLAKAKAENSIWLNGRSPFAKNSSGEHAIPAPAPLKLELVNEGKSPAAAQLQEKTELKENTQLKEGTQLQENTQLQEKRSAGETMIPAVASVQAPGPAVLNEASLTCVPSAPIELRSLERSEKLRSLEEELLGAPQRFAGASPRLRVLECWLKSQLWLTDRIAGQSSPKHLPHLDQLARIYQERQRNDLAELTYQRALHIREQFFGKGQPELAASIRGLASIYLDRGNFARAEEMYKEAIELQENGLRKILFLFSEGVTDELRLGSQLEALFGSISDLSHLYAVQGRQKLCAVVYEKALALAAEIIEREPSAENALGESVQNHLEMMKQLGVC